MDNDALLESQPDYVKQLEALPYKLRRAWLEATGTSWKALFLRNGRMTGSITRIGGIPM